MNSMTKGTKAKSMNPAAGVARVLPYPLKMIDFDIQIAHSTSAARIASFVSTDYRFLEEQDRFHRTLSGETILIQQARLAGLIVAFQSHVTKEL
jgi:hypothetical protein